MAYNPNFNRNAKGKFNPDLGLISIKGGTEAYLLEDELNELQWIQNEARAHLIRQMTNSGCLDINGFDNNVVVEGGLKELDNTDFNSFLLHGFDAVLNGYITRVDSEDSSGVVITLADPPTSGTRKDFVFLEFWFAEIKDTDQIRKFGGIHNSPQEYELIDKRLNFETSRRIQLQWNIRAISNVDINNYPKIFIDNNGSSNIAVKALGKNTIETNYNFRQHKDVNLFVSGQGSDADKLALKSMDGYIYAIPLFIVNRINNGGYHAEYNPNGGINYVNSNSISGRPDGKFSNIVYDDQVEDLRSLATLSQEQYVKLYVTKLEFNVYKQEIQNTIGADLTKLENDLFLLDSLVKQDILPTLALKADKSYVDAELAKLRTDLDNLDSSLTIQINEMSNTVTNNIMVNLTDINIRLDAVEDDLAQTKTDFSTQLSTLNNSLNGTITNNIANLQKQLNDHILEANAKFDVINANIATLNSNITSLNITTTDLMNITADLTTRVINIERQLEGLGPSVTDLVAYGVEMNKYNVVTAGGVVQPDNSVICVGMQVNVPYTVASDYTIASIISNVPDGKTGDLFFEKADTGFLVKNTGNGGISIEIIAFKVDNNKVYSGSGVLAGETGIKITRPLLATDFVYVYAKENFYGENGEIYVGQEADGFKVYNTGSLGNDFEWMIIDTTKLRAENVDLVNINLDGTGSISHASADYGTNFKVLLSAPTLPIDNIGDIGEITVQKSLNTFTVNNTGTATAAMKCLVFKDVND